MSRQESIIRSRPRRLTLRQYKQKFKIRSVAAGSSALQHCAFLLRHDMLR